MKNKKKKSIVIVIVVALLLVVGIASFFIYNTIESNKSLGTDWADIYYEFIKKGEKELSELKNQSKNYEVQFIPQEEGYPLMLLKYVSDKIESVKEVLKLFYINDEKKVETITISEKNNSIEIKLLYNNEEQKYKWYKVAILDNGYQYRDLERTIYLEKLKDRLGTSEDIEDNKEFKEVFDKTIIDIDNDEMPAETIEETTPISKFEKVFTIPQNVLEPIKVNISDITDNKQVKKELMEAVEEYKTMEDVVTEETKESVKEEIKKIENREAAIKKKAEDEAAKKAQEDKKKAEAAKNTFKVGKYTMTYGTYKGSGGFQGSNEGAILVLKPNGTYTITQNGLTLRGTFSSNSNGFIDFDDRSWSYKALGNNVLGAPEGAGYDEKFTFSGN